jgi:CO/xanthine dehydrogenase Mo-binding subunit
MNAAPRPQATPPSILFAAMFGLSTVPHDYQVLRLSEMPPVEVYLIDSGALPLGGTGEVGPVTVVPAVANALFVATGQRYRSLPLSRHGLRIV